MQEIGTGSQELLRLQFQRSFQAKLFVPAWRGSNPRASGSERPQFKSATLVLRDPAGVAPPLCASPSPLAKRTEHMPPHRAVRGSVRSCVEGTGAETHMPSPASYASEPTVTSLSLCSSHSLLPESLRGRDCCNHCTDEEAKARRVEVCPRPHRAQGTQPLHALGASGGALSSTGRALCGVQL